MSRSSMTLALLGLLLGCSEEVLPGAIEVSWRIGALGCAEAGIDKVNVELYDYYDGELDPSRLDVQPCSVKTANMTGLTPGDYTLLLRGFDTDNCWTHEARDEVNVPANGTLTVEPLALLRRQRPLLVRWPFENEGDCYLNEVEQVRVVVDVEDRYSEEFFFLCQGLGKEVPVDIPAGDLSVLVQALDARGQPLASGLTTAQSEVFTANPCDDQIEIRVPLALCETVDCTDN